MSSVFRIYPPAKKFMTLRSLIHHDELKAVLGGMFIKSLFFYYAPFHLCMFCENVCPNSFLDVFLKRAPQTELKLQLKIEIFCFELKVFELSSNWWLIYFKKICILHLKNTNASHEIVSGMLIIIKVKKCWQYVN